jgi:ubiquinone/menaquinone biosynthesis C-methylase UbiE
MDGTELRKMSVQEGYAAWATSYDQERNGLIFLEGRQVDRLLARISFKQVLDVGAGTGRHALKLARKGAKVTAVDQSPQMLAVARQIAQNEGLSIDFRLFSLGSSLPFETHQFDLVICALVLCHVPNIVHAIEEFARVLQSGGHLLITDFHPVHSNYGWETSFVRAGVKYQLPTVAHTKNDYLEAITNSGLTIIDVVENVFRELPQGYAQEQIMREHADTPLCLSIMARK